MYKRQTWDDPIFLIPVGFDYQYYDNSYDTILISNFGYGAYMGFEHAGPDLFPVLSAFGADLVDRASDTINFDGESGSVSPISYQVEGNAGSRILKVEWRNTGFYMDLTDDNLAQDSINLQLWLYEGSGTIEIHFGPSSIASPALDYDGESGSFVMLAPHVDLNSYNPVAETLWLDGNQASPSLTSGSTPSYLDGTVADGTIYRFALSAAGVNENIITSQISVFPNPASNRIYFKTTDLKFTNETIEITNATGRIVKSVSFSKNGIDVSELSNGIYFLRIATEAGSLSKRFIKD